MKIKEIVAEEAGGVGYIPKNKREANDPRYSMAMTQDIKPGEDARQAAKWGFKVGAGGKVPKLKTNGKIDESKLSELGAYKQHPAYAKSTAIFSNPMLRASSIRRNALDIFTEFLISHGFKKLGQGQFGVTYEKPGYPWIFKVFTYDSPYKLFLDYVFKNQSNPNLPKLKGYYIKINDNTYVVRMEKLQDISDDHPLAEFFDKLIGVNPANKLRDNNAKWLEKNYPGILKIMNDLKPLTKGKKWILDLHSGNMMLRGDTPVITDPFADMKYVWS